MKRTAPLPPVDSLDLPSKQAPAVRVVGDFATSGTKPKPAGDYVWRDPATGVIADPPAQPPASVVALERETRWWFWFWFIIGILFVVFFVVVLLWPVHRWEGDGGGGEHHGGGWPEKSPAVPAGPGVGDTKEDCTSDELWSEEARMCIMRSYYPQAVSPAIMDTSVSPCTDIYRHACGKWLDTHTNENRGFAGLAALNGVAVRNIVLNKSVANLNPFYQVALFGLAHSP